MRQARPIALVLSLALFAAASCKKSEPPPQAAPAPAAPPPAAQAPAAQPAAFAVTGVELGKQIGADKRIAEQAGVFAPGDTIYASVLTIGAAPSIVLKARWTFEDGQLVNESTQIIAPTGPAATEFHIAKPSGWPTGKYKIEVAANDAVVGHKEFEVR